MPRPGPRVALVLQGGGALGAYQAGAYQALHEHGLVPDWVVGTSIGAINGAIIAGNAPDQRIPRLRAFWDRVAHEDFVDMEHLPDPARRSNALLVAWDEILRGIPGFFLPRWLNPFAFGLPVSPERASFYDTAALARTLADLVDFDQLRAPGAMRLTVSAIQVTSGELVNFDSAEQALSVDHVLASGALPPGFPPVRIDGELHWDGGLYSNTPIETVLDDEPRVDTLCFMVDLWRGEGLEPETVHEVETRRKDVMYASRSRRHIEAYRRMHEMRHAISMLYNKLPPKLRLSPEVRAAASMGCETTMHIVHLPYAGQDWQMPSKDLNFSRGSIGWRWEQGYRHASRAAGLGAWLSPHLPHTGVVVHELPPELEPA